MTFLPLLEMILALCANCYFPLTFYSFDRAQIEKLIDYVITESKSEDTSNRAFKYPFIAAEILSSDLKEITDQFFIADSSTQSTFPLLEKLLSFLNPTTEFNPVLTGYFCLVLNSLIDYRRKEIWEYVTTHEKYMDNLIKCANIEQIADLIAKLVKEDNGDINLGKEHKEVIMKLMKDSNNGWNVISSLISLHVYIDYFSSEESVVLIFKTIICNPEIADKAFKILYSLIDAIVVLKTPMSPFESFQGSDQLEKYQVTQIVKHTMLHLELLKSLLHRDELWKHLGVIKFIQSIAQLKDEEMNSKMIENDLISVLIELFTKYPDSTVLHMRVYKTIKELFIPIHISLIKNLFKQNPIANKLLAIYKEGTKGFTFDNGKKLNKPYMIFITQLCWALKELAKNSKELEETLKGVEGWEEFVEGELEEIYVKENTKMGEDVKSQIEKAFVKSLYEVAKVEEDNKDDEDMFDKEESFKDELEEDSPIKRDEDLINSQNKSILKKKLKYEEDPEEENALIYIPQMENSGSDI